MILAFFKKISNLGVDSKNTKEKNKTIRLINLICVLWYVAFMLIALMILSGLISYTEDKYYKGISINLIGLSIVAVIHYLNKIKKFALAAFGMLLFMTAYFFIITTFSAPQKFIEFFYILIPIISLVFFDKNKFSWFFLGLSIVIFHYTFIHLGFYQHDGVLFLPPLMIWLFVLNFLIVLYFKKLNQNSEKLLEVERDKVLDDKIILEKQEAELRELNEFKSHFFVNLSHEIRTPLTLIQGYTNQLHFKDSDKENKEKTAIIKEQCLQMQHIINSIMDLSKMETSELQLNYTSVDLTAFLEKHSANFKSLFTEKNIAFSLHNQTPNTSLKIDQELFSKAISNLLSNALKFTPTNGQVSINTYIDNDCLKITVIDSGIGIEKTETEAIFNRFYQVKNDITQSQGSGIGLAFTKSIIEAHDFSINVDSNINEGTCFSICIPKAFTHSIQDNTTENTAHFKAATSSNVLPRTITSTTKQRILLVEDHEHMRTYLKNVLKNYNVTLAENGKEALNIIKNNNFDLIVTDYMMPIMDGEALVKQLKKQHDKTPIIVLTARTDNHGKLAMLRLGIDGYLHKPFMEEEFLIHVKNSMALYKNVTEFDAHNSEEDTKALNAFADKFNIKLTAYINKNINSPLLTVDAISEYMKVSKSTLNRKVKSILGQTVNQLIQEARLEKARQLRMEDPFASKKQIAEAVGVTNTTYLFDKLKSRYGI